jgi:hypothetical protein
MQAGTVSTLSERVDKEKFGKVKNLLLLPLLLRRL